MQGPIGSGKTTTMIARIFTEACRQPRSPLDGMRYQRWAVIRNTTPMLRTTTIASWLEEFPEEAWGPMRWSPPFTHRIVHGDVSLEVIFLALDRPEDVRKVLSMALTGAFFNESREIDLEIIQNVMSRTGRYPSMKHGGPPKPQWGLADTNAPAHDHWWPLMSGQSDPPAEMSREDRLSLVKPEGWKFYNQPPAMTRVRDEFGTVVGYELNPEAENLHNLREGYYEAQTRGRTASFIKVQVLNELGVIIQGDPVFKDSFNRDFHVVNREIKVNPELPLRGGMDFGVPAFVLMQREPSGLWYAIWEIVMRKSMPARRFARLVKALLNSKQAWPGQPIILSGDPKGADTAQADDITAFQMCQAEELFVSPAPTNDIQIRIEVWEMAMSRLVDGVPGFQVSSVGCPTLVNALEAGYVYDRSNKPAKNHFSHVVDAGGYCMLGGGEQMTVLPHYDREVAEGPVNLRPRPSPFNRLRGGRPSREMRRNIQHQ